MYSKPQEKTNNLWGVEINGKRGFVPANLIRETKILKKRDLLQNIELGTANKVPSKTETVENATPGAEIAPKSVQKNYEVVDGTTVYIDDVINPSATQDPVEPTAINDFNSDVQTEPLALKVGSDNTIDKTEAEKSINNDDLQPTGSFFGDVMNSLTNLIDSNASEENDDENEDDEDDEEEEDEESNEDKESVEEQLETLPETIVNDASAEQIQQTVGEKKSENENGEEIKAEQTVMELAKDKTLKEGKNVYEASEIKTEDSELNIKAATLEIDTPSNMDVNEFENKENNASNSADEVVQKDEPQNVTETESFVKENQAEKTSSAPAEILPAAENTNPADTTHVVKDDFKSEENTGNTDELPKEMVSPDNLEPPKDDIVSEINSPPTESTAAESQATAIPITTEESVSQEIPLPLDTYTETQTPLPESVTEYKIDAADTPPLEIPSIPKDENVVEVEQPQIVVQENTFENLQEFSILKESENIKDMPKDASVSEKTVNYENENSIAIEQANFVQNSEEVSTESLPSSGLFGGLYANVFAEETATEKVINNENLITGEESTLTQIPEQVSTESGSSSVLPEVVATDKVINHENENLVADEESKLVQSSEDASMQDGSSNGFLDGIYSSMFGGQGVEQKQEDVVESVRQVGGDEGQKQEQVAESTLTAENNVGEGRTSDEIPPAKVDGKSEVPFCIF